MADVKTLSSKILTLVADKAMDVVEKGVRSPKIRELKPYQYVETQVPWLGKLTDAIIDATDAIDTGVSLGYINKQQLQASIRYAPEIAATNPGGRNVGAILGIGFTGADAERSVKIIRTIFHGGELYDEKGKKTVLNGRPGYNEKYVHKTAQMLADYLAKDITEKDPDIKKLIEDIEDAAKKEQ